MAAAQSPVTCDPSANGAAVRSLMVVAREQGARLVQFPEGAISGYPGTPRVFLDYRARDVDCVLFSSFSQDPIFDILARAHAATNSYWVSVSVPAQYSTGMPAGVIGRATFPGILSVVGAAVGGVA